MIDRYLAKEVELERVISLLESGSLPAAQISRFGGDSHQPGKWRLIVDLSHPKGVSVNDGKELEQLCSLSCTSVDKAVQVVCSMGLGTRKAKVYVEIVPVHPTDRPLLGMMWKGGLYIDTALPLGLRSAPKIFNAVADALQWIFSANGVTPSTTLITTSSTTLTTSS